MTHELNSLFYFKSRRFKQSTCPAVLKVTISPPGLPGPEAQEPPVAFAAYGHSSLHSATEYKGPDHDDLTYVNVIGLRLFFFFSPLVPSALGRAALRLADSSSSVCRAAGFKT